MPKDRGPLVGVRVVEMAAIGPVPFAGMMLADLGADVVRVDRPGPPEELPGALGGADVFGRGKRSVTVDLKHMDGPAVVLELVRSADVLLEGLRPGVMERLGVGPDECLAANEQLVYGRMTGFGQDGPLAQQAGHDINYIAVAGVLGRIGRPGMAPVPPLNLVGDFGGGAMFLVTGVLAALMERASSGRGQVVDAAMVDGAALLSVGTFSGAPRPPRGLGVLDGGSPFYDAFETSDGRYLSVGPIEPRFWATFVRILGLDPGMVTQDRINWARSKEQVAGLIRSRSRDEWLDIFAGTDSCVAPVLDHEELFEYPHHKARMAFVDIDGVPQPAPAPRFSRSSPAVPRGAPIRGAATDEILAENGLSPERIATLRASGAVGG